MHKGYPHIGYGQWRGSQQYLHYEIKFLAKQSNPKPFMTLGLANYDDLFKQVQEVK